ncbi:MAG: hypothetical protein AUH72_07240 [Acidobacteria bacterium 13_1_40CM_4_65_8]|nr:MAG: hypothetical protein AUH72_07240 [Acidobacteria bacterium 13_1_40CM_4_65_8]
MTEPFVAVAVAETAIVAGSWNVLPLVGAVRLTVVTVGVGGGAGALETVILTVADIDWLPAASLATTAKV